MTRSPHYPHTPSSATQLRVGDIVPVPDPSGWWACLQVVELEPRVRSSWIYGLLPWRGWHEPAVADVHGLPPLHRGLTRMEVFTEGRLSVTGCTPPSDDGQELFHGPSYVGKSQRVTGWAACVRLAQQYARTGSDDPRTVEGPPSIAGPERRLL